MFKKTYSTVHPKTTSQNSKEKLVLALDPVPVPEPETETAAEMCR